MTSVPKEREKSVEERAAIAERTAYDAISALFQSIEESVKAANRLDRAYWAGVGKPEEYIPFDVNQPEKVAMALAGLYATDTAANILASMQLQSQEFATLQKVTLVDYIQLLRRIVYGNFSERERYIVCNLANATWRSGQPFRNITTAPLSRITRDTNIQFNTLPPEQKAKDWSQIHEGAKILLEKIAESGVEI